MLGKCDAQIKTKLFIIKGEQWFTSQCGNWFLLQNTFNSFHFLCGPAEQKGLGFGFGLRLGGASCKPNLGQCLETLPLQSDRRELGALVTMSFPCAETLVLFVDDTFQAFSILGLYCSGVLTLEGTLRPTRLGGLGYFPWEHSKHSILWLLWVKFRQERWIESSWSGDTGCLSGNVCSGFINPGSTEQMSNFGD